MKIVFIILIFIFTSCSKSKNVFNGEFRQVQLKNGVIELHEIALNIEELNAVDMVVVDTFLVMDSEHYDDYFFSVYNLNNSQFLGRYVSKGRGPLECLYTSIRSENQDDSTGIWLFESPEIKVLNMARSIEQKKAFFSDKINLPNLRFVNSVSYWYRICDSLIVGKEVLHSNPKENIRILKYNLKQDSLVDQFIMYNNKHSADYSIFFGAFGVKIDGSRVVNSMLFFNQLNFYDFDTHRSFSVSCDEKPVEISEIPAIKSQSLESYSVRKHYYIKLRVTKELIFISYGEDKDPETQEASEIHVFNWEGDFLYILKPKKKFKTFEIDEKAQQLYLYRIDDKVYRCSIKPVFN